MSINKVKLNMLHGYVSPVFEKAKELSLFHEESFAIYNNMDEPI